MASLYVTATPIGNLQDFSPRGIETLKNADLIIAEDTRMAMKLGQVFGFRSRMISCHRHNEEDKAQAIADEIAAHNLNAALVTDAGTPCISDPGHELVSACIARGINVIPVPGCNAGIAAVSVSGFDARTFSFYGFLPREKKALKEELIRIAHGMPVAVLHESPHRIIHLTEAVAEVLPDARMAVCCDLTKKFEKTVYGSPTEVLSDLKSNDKAEKGEYCIVLDLHGIKQDADHTAPDSDVLSLEGKLGEEIAKGLTLREAQEVLLQKGEKKNAVKQAALNLKKAVQ